MSSSLALPFWMVYGALSRPACKFPWHASAAGGVWRCGVAAVSMVRFSSSTCPFSAVSALSEICHCLSMLTPAWSSPTRGTPELHMLSHASLPKGESQKGRLAPVCHAAVFDVAAAVAGGSSVACCFGVHIPAICAAVWASCACNGCVHYAI
jgi:hypothetical protein